MATTVKSPNKTTFVTEYLTRNPTANHAAVKDAWAADGHGGSISQTLVSNLRSKLNLTGNTRRGARSSVSKTATQTQVKRGPGRPRLDANSAKAKAASTATVRKSPREKLLAEVESDFDRLIFKLMEAGGLTKVEDVLRSARRVVVRSHQG